MNPEIGLVLSNAQILLFLPQFCKLLAIYLIKSHHYSWSLAFAFFSFMLTHFAHVTDWLKWGERGETQGGFCINTVIVYQIRERMPVTAGYGDTGVNELK